MKNRPPKIVRKENGVLIGKLTPKIAKQIKKESGDIYITVKYLQHIKNRHNIELKQLGIDVLSYLRMIVTQCNEIRQGTEDSILLIVRQYENHHHTAAIVLKYDIPNNWWQIKTAEPRSTADLNKRKLLWEEGQFPQ